MTIFLNTLYFCLYIYLLVVGALNKPFQIFNAYADELGSRANSPVCAVTKGWGGVENEPNDTK